MTLILLLGFASVLAIFLHALEQTDRLIGRGKTLLSLAPDLTFAATVYVVATTGQWIPLVVDVVSKRLLYGLFRHLLIRLHIRRVIKQVFDQFIKGREVEDGTAVIVKGGEKGVEEVTAISPNGTKTRLSPTNCPYRQKQVQSEDET